MRQTHWRRQEKTMRPYIPPPRITVLLILQFCRQNPPSSCTQRDASALLLLGSRSVVVLLLMPVPLREGNADAGPHSVVKAESGMPCLCKVMNNKLK